jgi:hypothetical protein
MSTSTQKRVARIYRLGADAHHHRHERGYMARLAQDNDISGGTLSKARAIVEAASRISRNADDVTLLRIHWEDTCGEERGVLAAAEELVHGNPFPWMAVFDSSENAYRVMKGNPLNKPRKGKRK